MKSRSARIILKYGMKEDGFWKLWFWKMRSQKKPSSKHHPLTLEYIEDKFVDESLDLGDHIFAFRNEVHSEPDN